MTKTTINKEELKKFEAMAEEWWDPAGKFKPLHQFNPVRLNFIISQLQTHYNLKELNLSKVNILDVGCGGGLVAEPLDNLKAKVTAIDASEININIAKTHQKTSGSKVDYQTSTIEDLKNNKKFDVITCLEVVEHVDNLEFLLSNLKKNVKKNGLIFIATINRTIKSMLLAKFAAEYILGWLPRGTHDFRKFLKPSELNNLIGQEVDLLMQTGFKYNILTNSWNLTSDLSQNYMMVFEKKS